MYQQIYDSPWLVTFAVALISFVGLALWLRRGNFLVAFIVLFTIEILGDALRSGNWSPLHLLSSEWEDPVGLLFVMLGDFRYFFLAERYAWKPDIGPREATPPPAVLASILVSLIVPLTVLSLQHVFSPVLNQGYPMYLAWEGLFLIVGSIYRWGVLPRRLAKAPEPVRRWLYQVTAFVLVTYALWFVSDLFLLAGHDGALLLRIVPNFLYYGFFLLFVAYRAPAEVTE